MRDVLLKRIRPLVERLANDLVDLAFERIEAELERLPHAFEAALSAYASDGPVDLITAALGPELAGIPPPRAKADSDAEPMTAIEPDRYRPPTPGELAAAKARIARITARSLASVRRVESNSNAEENQNAEERWSPQRIGDERELAESRKLEGSLPAPRSTFTVTARSARSFGADLGDVSELGATTE